VPCILKYMPYVFRNKPCVFSHVPKLHFFLLFIVMPVIIFRTQMLIRMALSNFYGQTNFRQG